MYLVMCLMCFIFFPANGEDCKTHQPLHKALRSIINDLQVEDLPLREVNVKKRLIDMKFGEGVLGNFSSLEIVETKVCRSQPLVTSVVCQLVVKHAYLGYKDVHVASPIFVKLAKMLTSVYRLRLEIGFTVHSRSRTCSVELNYLNIDHHEWSKYRVSDIIMKSILRVFGFIVGIQQLKEFFQDALFTLLKPHFEHDIAEEICAAFNQSVKP